MYRWDGDLDVYVMAEEEWQPLLVRCLELISFGDTAGSIRGRGAFEIEEICEAGFKTPEDPNAYMTLSDPFNTGKCLCPANTG